MNNFKRTVIVAAASACGFVAIVGGAEARLTPQRQAQHLSAVDPSFDDNGIRSPAASALRDTDGGNADNPALPEYAQNRGQETGGPARELIPN